jgi:hypothetical protein
VISCCASVAGGEDALVAEQPPRHKPHKLKKTKRRRERESIRMRPFRPVYTVALPGALLIFPK